MAWLCHYRVMAFAAIKSKNRGMDLFSAACALAAGACCALYIIFGQKMGVYYGPGAVSVGSLIAACLFCLIGIIDNRIDLCSSEVLPFGIAIAILSSSFFFH